MSGWEIVAAALAPVLAKALYDVGEEVIAKPLMGPAAERFKAWVRRGYDARVDDEQVKKAVEAAAQASGLVEVRDWERYPLRVALNMLSGRGEEQDALRKQAVATALAMTRGALEEVPDGLLESLRLRERHRSDLARFLWAFRRALVKANEDYRALVELAGADETRSLLRRLASAVTEEGSIRVRSTPPAQREIEKPYLSMLVESECRFLPLSGRDPRASTPTGLPMRLEEVYVALNTTERPPQAREGKRGLLAEPTEAARMESFSALRIFLDHPHLVLLGEPGSGKTTFADHLALCLAGERCEPGAGWTRHLTTHDATWEGSALLPIRLRLRHFAADTECLPAGRDERGQAEHLLAYIEKVLKAGHYGADFLDHALRCLGSGDALLILDGLDEVGDPARREQVAHAIVDLAQRRYPRARLLVTCRMRQYPLDAAGRPKAAWALSGFYVATLADFDSTQIDRFVETWFNELCARGCFSEEICDQKIASLKEAIGLRADLQEIAPRPILLTQMTLVHDIEGELPGTRVQLYAECAELLLWKWEQLRAERAGRRLVAEGFIREQMGIPGLQKEDLQRALDHAVFDVHAEQGAAGEGPADIPERVLRERLAECLVRGGLAEPQASIKAQFFIDEYLHHRNGLIVPASEHTFQTPHRTFQEFLVARWLQEQRGFDRDAPRRVREKYDLWREVFLLAVGQAGLNNAVDAVDVLCPREWPADADGWRQLILAGQGLNEIGLTKVRSDDKGPEVEQRIVLLLQRTMQDVDQKSQPYKRPRVPIPIRYAAAETLDRLGWLPGDLNTWVEVQIRNPESGIPDRVRVGRYPVTNAQFALFIAAGGYGNPTYWDGKDGVAWRWRVKEHGKYRGEGPVTQPEYWDDARFGRSRRGYPVVGVSWYEASAYAAWLTELLRRRRAGEELEPVYQGLIAGLPEHVAVVRLLADEEWVAAAGGEGDRYPWGQEWDESRANTEEGGIRGTTPVAMYPSGRGPGGVWDMGGNVWEWVATWYGKEREYRILRGGSWNLDQGFARVGVRLRDLPDGSDSDLGFRLVGSPACSDS